MSKKKLNLIIKFSLIISLSTFIITAITLVIITYNMDYKLPQISHIELYDNENKKYLSYCNGNKQTYVDLNNISDYLIDSFISIEDKRFYKHKGIDIIRIFGALFSNIKNKGLSEGASTITQQYVRTLFLSSDKTFKRKINEILIAINLETKYSKEEILEGYLNSIYFDHGVYGVEDASIYYFNKHASELTLLEATTLASIPKGPSIYSPIKNKENNKKRRNLILKELLNDKQITTEEYNNALNEELILIGNNPNDDYNNAPYFQDVVLEELKRNEDLMEASKEGIKVYTTLDSRLNDIIVNSINTRLPNEEIEIAVYCVEPKTGKVLSIIGGKDYTESTYNRAVKSNRQPGSTIKPFLYLSALENGFTPATTFKSEKTIFYINKQPYSPGNYKDIYADTDISMLYALAVSDNIYAVKTHLFLGMTSLVNMMKRLGFSGDIPSIPSLALGSSEVTIKELATAYQALANEGVQYKPIFISKVTDKDDNIIYENKSIKTEVAEKSDVFLLNESMTSIFDNNMTYNIRPTGAAISSLLSHKYAGKSGSTDSDNWMVGYNPDILTVVWTGYDDNRKITNLSESRFGKYVWADTVEGYYNGRSSSWYEIPDDIISIDLNPMSGFYAGFDEYHKSVYFKKSNIPWYIKFLYYN